MLLKVDCLPNAVGKQPSIPLIYLGRKMDVKLMMMMMMMMMTIKSKLFFSAPGSQICRNRKHSLVCQAPHNALLEGL